MRTLALIMVVTAIGCGGSTKPGAKNNEPATYNETPSAPVTQNSQPKAVQKTLLESKQGFVTKIVKAGESYGPPDVPEGDKFELIRYESPAGKLAAYVTTDPGDNKKHPAIVWITGGDNNSIGDVWSPSDRGNDQSASAFQKAGIVMMFPSQRGGNDNPGKREGFYGEVDDVLAATDHLEKLPYVDKEQIYLGGHSTGGTLTMLIGASTNRYRAIFSLGPVALIQQYGGDFVYCDPNNTTELGLRSPMRWLHCIESPLYVLEGGRNGNWAAVQAMARVNSNPKIQFIKVPGHDHFSVIAPLAEVLAQQILDGMITISDATVQDLK